MSYILKKGRLTFIGRNVRVTRIKSELCEKRSALYNDSHLISLLENLDSKGFLKTASDDPVSFTYSMWRLFHNDAKKATSKICELAIKKDPKVVLRSLEIMLFDASPKINAFCLEYIISQMNGFVDTNPQKVKKAIKEMIKADFSATLRIIKMMYQSSPRATKEIAKKLISKNKLQLLKIFITPTIKTNRY